MSKKADTQQPIQHFEASLSELEKLVEKMEEGELSLDDSLKSFERGITLFRYCQQALQEAELKVRELSNLDTDDTGDTDSDDTIQDDDDGLPF